MACGVCQRIFVLGVHRRPGVITDAELAGGNDGISDISDSDYIGDSALRTGLYHRFKGLIHRYLKLEDLLA